MQQALYRKWRPRTFDEVCGQEHITSILKYESANSKFSHAYLFCGSRGTGKTSCAKIVAKAVNCLSLVDGNPCGECSACKAIDNSSATDVLEMDAASNNGVDNIRDIRDEVIYSPSILKYRVYIIDEVHMLSTSAFNALLKTLEEPPEHVIFILATTELQKLPATIISRCQRFDFRRISTDVLKNHLLYIADQEKIEIDESAALLLAKAAQGGMRDAISLLDLCAGNRQRIDDKLVNQVIGSSGREQIAEVVRAVAERNYEFIFKSVDEVACSSRDIAVFWQELISFYRDLLVIKTSKNARDYLDLTDSETESLVEIAKLFTIERLSYHCKMLEEGLFSMQKSNAVKRIVAELTLVRMCDERLSLSNEAILYRISALENSETVAKKSNVAAAEMKEKQSADVKERANKQISENDDEMLRSDSPKRKETSPVKSANTSKTIGNVRTLKPFKSRAEALEKMISADVATGSWFCNAKWYCDENENFVIKFESQFVADNVKNMGGEELFLRAVSDTVGRTLTKKNVSFEYDAIGKTNELIDEIIEAVEEN